MTTMHRKPTMMATARQATTRMTMTMAQFVMTITKMVVDVDNEDNNDNNKDNNSRLTMSNKGNNRNCGDSEDA